MLSKSIAFHDYCSGMTYPVGRSRTPFGRFALLRHCSSPAARGHGNRYQMRSQLVSKYCFAAAAMSLLVMPLQIHTQDSQSTGNKTVSDLSSDNLKSIQVTGKNGTESLPIGALVQVYGCIKENPVNAWTLAGATKALRTRNPDKSSAADLKQAEAKLPADATYRLVDAAFYHPEHYKDQMAEVKGFLVADPRDGISVTSVASLSTPCP